MQSELVEIDIITKNGPDGDFFSFHVRKTEKLLDLPGETAPAANAFHLGNHLQTVDKRLHFCVVLSEKLKRVQSFGASVERTVEHIAHLHFHQQSQGNHHDGDHILKDNEHLAEQHFAPKPVAAAHNIYGCESRRHGRRSQTRQTTCQHNDQKVGRETGRRHAYPNRRELPCVEAVVA